MFMKKIFPILVLITLSLSALAQTGQKGTSVRTKYNFNGNWQLHYPSACINTGGQTRTVTLPRAWNEDYAYRVSISSLPDDTCRYTKTFAVPEEWKDNKGFVEFVGRGRYRLVK